MVNWRVLLGIAFGAATALALAAGALGGLVRAGVAWEALSGAGWLPHAVLDHAFLMVSAFLGTVIGLERAVAVKHPAAFAAPLASALSGVWMVAGLPDVAGCFAVAAATAFVAVNAVLVTRQPAGHTRLLLVAALAWWVGALAHLADAAVQGTVSWWLGFLVLTIAAERLEMARLMPRHPAAQPMLLAALGALLAACLLSLFERAATVGGVLYGAALLGLSAWLLRFDIARKTVATQGLSRYMAVCLLLGYGWLAVAGLAWIGSSLGLPWRDAALHGLALGFVFSMIFGHAPVILPALARVKIAYSAALYLPLGVLHASLVARLLLAHIDPSLMQWGSVLNVLAMVLFMLTVGGLRRRARR